MNASTPSCGANHHRTTDARLGAFVTTHWSVVLAAKDKDSPESGQALETLCRSYWYPLYGFVRRCGHQPADAQDLVQEFFARLLQKDYLHSVERERGRFRTFLIMALKRFLANDWDHARAQKRGGGQAPLPLDTALAENRFQEEASAEFGTDLAFDREWAITLLDQALDHVKAEHEHAGKGREFAYLRKYLAVGQETIPYAEAAIALGQTQAAIKMAVHRLRRRYRCVFRDLITETVSTPADVDEEMRHLLDVLSY